MTLRMSRVVAAGAAAGLAVMLAACTPAQSPNPTSGPDATTLGAQPTQDPVDPASPATDSTGGAGGGDAGAATQAPPETHGVAGGGPHSITFDGTPQNADFLAAATCVTDHLGVLTIHAGAKVGQQGDSLHAVLESAGDGPKVSLSVGGDSFPLYGATQLKRDGETMTITGEAVTGPRAKQTQVEIVVTCTTN